MNRLLDLCLLHERQRFADLMVAATEALSTAEVGAGGTAAALAPQAIAHQHLGEFAEVGTMGAMLEPQVESPEADAQTNWAAQLILGGRIKLAHRWLDGVLATTPNHALALARRAWCRMALGEVEAASVDMANSLELAPKRLGAWPRWRTKRNTTMRPTPCPAKCWPSSPTTSEPCAPWVGRRCSAAIQTLSALRRQGAPPAMRPHTSRAWPGAL